MASSFRLTPTSNSRKLGVLKYVHEYFAEFGASPALSEIAAHLGGGASVKTAHRLIDELVDEGSLAKVPGKRGLRLPDAHAMLSEASVLALLQARGWTIFGDDRALVPPIATAFPVTKSGLPRLPSLDHIPDVEPGDQGAAA